jgi:hypothetical protein
MAGLRAISRTEVGTEGKRHLAKADEWRKRRKSYSTQK